MGGGRWSESDWKGYTSKSGYSSKTVHEIYASKLDEDLDPKGVKVRESRDSDDNPVSNAIIIGLDVTGSMSSVLDAMARKGLNTLCTEIYDRKPVQDPHIMCMGIGDAEAGDRAPLQVTQFEADIRIAKQLEKIWLEQGGGGNSYESYALAWYFAANHTSIDCFEKRNKKGYLFTIGDENPTPYLRAEDIERVFGDKIQGDKISMEDILTKVSRQWNIFHVMVEEGSNYTHETPKLWRNLLGQHAITLADHSKFGEVVVSTLQVCEGADKKSVIDSWDGNTSIVVKKATENLTVLNPIKKDTGVVAL